MKRETLEQMKTMLELSFEPENRPYWITALVNQKRITKAEAGKLFSELDCERRSTLRTPTF